LTDERRTMMPDMEMSRLWRQPKHKKRYELPVYLVTLYAFILNYF